MCQLIIPHENYFVFEMYLPTWIWDGPSPVARETERMMKNLFEGSTILPNLIGSYRDCTESVMLIRFLVPVPEIEQEKRLNDIAGFLLSRARSIADAWGEYEVWIAYLGIQKIIKAVNFASESRSPANRVYWTINERKNGYTESSNLEQDVT